jgi:hypothetical protein
MRGYQPCINGEFVTARYRASVSEIIGIFAGEAGLLGACAGYSDTLRERRRDR